MSKWQLWTIVFHVVATKEGLDCVEVRSEETKSNGEVRDAMVVKTVMPADWVNSNSASAQMVYVHATDTSRYFVFTFQERQGNKIEVKLEKVRKVPALTEPAPPTVSKFIPMQQEDFWPA